MMPPPQALKAAFTALMTCDAAKVSAAISSLVARLNQEAQGGRQLSDKEQLVLRLNTQYPGDVGVLSAFFLNQVTVLTSVVLEWVVVCSCWGWRVPYMLMDAKDMLCGPGRMACAAAAVQRFVLGDTQHASFAQHKESASQYSPGPLVLLCCAGATEPL
jgi:hypothetical protein